MMDVEWEDDRTSGGLLTPREVTTCLTEAEFEGFLFNRLSGTTREVIEQHLLYCASCLDRVEAEEDFAGVMRESCRHMEAEAATQAFGPSAGERRRSRWLKLLSWFGGPIPTLAMVTGLAVLTLIPGRNLLRPPVMEVALRVERGAAGGGVEAPAGRPLRLSLDLRALPQFKSYELEVADALGGVVAAQTIIPLADPTVKATVERRSAGQYWVRVYSPAPAHELLQEYSLRVK